MLECQDCHKEKPDVKETFCPFAQEVHHEDIEIIVCDNCYQERVWDI
jgi:hypothetical protein